MNATSTNSFELSMPSLNPSCWGTVKPAPAPPGPPSAFCWRLPLVRVVTATTRSVRELSQPGLEAKGPDKPFWTSRWIGLEGKGGRDRHDGYHFETLCQRWHQGGRRPNSAPAQSLHCHQQKTLRPPAATSLPSGWRTRGISTPVSPRLVVTMPPIPKLGSRCPLAG
jgi:hypothetical protein